MHNQWVPEGVLAALFPVVRTLCQCQVRSVRRWVEVLYHWELDFAIAVFWDRCVTFVRCFRMMLSRCWVAAEVSFWLNRHRRDLGDDMVSPNLLREPLIVLVCGSMIRGYLDAAAGVSPCTSTVCGHHRWV